MAGAADYVLGHDYGILRGFRAYFRQMHTFLGELHRQTGPRPWLLLVPLLVSALLLALPPLLKPRSNQAVGEILSVTLAPGTDGPWYPVNLRALVPPDDYAWLKVVFNVPSMAAREDVPPLGLFLSGAFSAAAYWNGTYIGSKGEPARMPDTEVPGPVDTVLFLDNSLPTAGNNTLLLEISSHYRPANITSIIHGSAEIFGIRLAPYSAEARRSLNYYIVPLIVTVLLISGFIVMLWRGSSPLGIDCVMVGALLVAACAELFRSFYAYPYQYHVYRIGTVSIALRIFFALLPIQAFWRTSTERPMPTRFPTSMAVGTVSTLIALWTRYYPACLSLLAIVLCCLQWQPRLRLKIPDLKLLLSLLCLFIVSALFGLDGVFEDRYLYVAIIPWLAYLAWPFVSQSSLEEKPEGIKDKLVVKSAGKQQIVAFNNIVAFSGAGNYAEISLQNTSKLLDDRTLKSLEKELPNCFYRIHRSHIANINYVETVRSEGGGKYLAIMANQQTLPISRNRIRELRKRIDYRMAL